jgi:hypothetical protein
MVKNGGEVRERHFPAYLLWRDWKMLEKLLLKVKSDKNFLERQKSLEEFRERFKSCSGKTIDDFPVEELGKHANVIKEFLGRHEKVSNFFEAVEDITPDTTSVAYI